MKKLLVIGIVAVAIVIFGTTATMQTAKEREFSILDYNNALTQYNEGKYAQAYNTLLDSNAPVEAYKAFGWEVK